MNASVTGVGPLVCAVCETTVGAINLSALDRMLQADEIYICQIVLIVTRISRSS